MAADARQIRQSIQAGRSALERGDVDAARRGLAGIDHPEAKYLLALAAQQQADFGAAERAYRRALELAPEFPQAADSLGRLMIDLGRWDDAASVYERLLASDPRSLPGRYGLATARLNRGECDLALRGFDELISAGNDRPEIRFMRARARLEIGELDAGLDDLRNAHARQPTDYTLKTLAGALWMQGDRSAFDALLRDALRTATLLPMAAELLRASGEPDRAIAVIDSALGAAVEMEPSASAVLAQAYADIGDAAAAESVARAGHDAAPDDRGISANLISALLMQGKADEALALLAPLRQSEPDRQHWIAYEATALRLIGDPRYAGLVDMDRFVRADRLPVPPGYDSLAAFNEALFRALAPLYQYREHPLDQSLRHGSQTSRDLTSVDDPVISAYIRALDVPIRNYMRTVGSGPDHPLTARNTGDYRIAGCWSVKLHAGGRHVNHVHPEGWISSAYYVVVPDEVDDETGKAGWIKFGEPPFETSPPTPPEKWIRPEAGLVVLFPSFLWHGTEAIHDRSVRVTAPFDVVPA